MKRILHTQLEYVVHKSNLDRAKKELARLKRSGADPAEIAKAQLRVDNLKEKSKIANQAIEASGVSKTTIGK